MLIEILDRDAGALQVDAEGFATLRKAQDPAADAPVNAVLALSTPSVAEALQLIDAPDLTVTVTVAGWESCHTHRLWYRLGAGVALTGVALIGVRGDESRLLPVSPAALAGDLARLVRLKPRRIDIERAEEVTTPTELDAVVDPDPVLRRAALVGVGADFGWRITAQGRSEEPVTLTAVDGPHGVYLADESASLLRPESNTMVFRIFSALLPAMAGELQDDALS